MDTNVVVSGIFFGGVPRRALELWAEGRFELVLSPAIFDEYLRTCDRLGAAHRNLEYREVLAALVGHGTLVPDDPEERITADADDDKFMLCARRAGAIVVSGDSDLLNAGGWENVKVLNPRDFVELVVKG